MLSVLIPTYNYSAVLLVKALQKQLLSQNVLFEIICFDDGSNGEENNKNNKINNLEFCQFKAFRKGLGRSKIRNLLAENAKYEWLLFLDSDVLPIEQVFIKNYFESVKKTPNKVFYGGLKYEDKKPSTKKILRWTYGKSREEISYNTRWQTNQNHFSSANFLISKELFNKIKFDETLTKYGYEDTLFAIELLANKSTIYQVDSPVYHLGLDDSDVFLGKTKRAIENLKYLHQEKKISNEDIKLLKSFNKVNSYGLNSLLSLFYKGYFNKMEDNLMSKKPSLLVYDIYKLSYLCSIS